jgi:hypothetical protein
MLENLAGAENPAHANSVAVLLDGAVAYLAGGELWPAGAGGPTTGANTSGLSSAGRQLFTGAITGVRRFDSVKEAISWRQVYRWDRHYPQEGHLPAGPVRLHLTLPKEAVGRSEPLLVAGVAGKADSIFVTYVDPSHIRVGFDHWGVGAANSGVIAVDYSAPHEFAIDLASMHGLAGPHGKATVALDGKIVLSSEMGAHPAKDPEIVFGANDVEASTSGRRFTGELTRIDFQGD